MTKLKTLTRKYQIVFGVLCLVAVVGVGLSVRAYTSETPPTTVIENAGGVTINNPAPEPQIVEEGLGAMASPNIVSRWISVNGDTTYHITGDFLNATTTIVSFPSPFLIATSSTSNVVIDGTTNSGFGYTSATTTVDLVRLDIGTAATSTFSVTCGASDTNGYTAAAGIDTSLLATAAEAVATSSVGIIENNLTAALGGAVDSGTVEKITLNPNYPYFTCLVTSVYTGAFTEVTNTFDGKFTVHLHKQR